MDRTLYVVLFAGALNAAQAVAKLAAYLLTGSPSMLATTYHSVSDTVNQVLLLVGLRYSRMKPSRQHPFGHGKAVFFYTFLVSVLIFGIAGWESLQSGFYAFLNGSAVVEEGSVELLGRSIRGVHLAYAVMVFSIAFDSVTYLEAKKAFDLDTRSRGWRGFVDSFRKTSDTPVLEVLGENGVAVVGGVVALVSVYLTDVTGLHYFDAAGALLIGGMLAAFALALAWETKQLLLGEALPRSQEEPLEELVEKADGVEELYDLRSVYWGPSDVLVTADVGFEPGLDTDEIEELIDEIESELRQEQPLVRKVYIEPQRATETADTSGT